MTMRVWTIGHSTLEAAEFLGLLRENGIELLVDIRRFPTSRWPQFTGPNLRDHLAGADIEYVHLEQLGGFRRGGYPAYTKTPAFAAGLERLLELAANTPTAVMCAEAVFFRCHRRHVADVLVRRGVEVLHIMRPSKVQRHVATENLPVKAPSRSGGGKT